MSVSPLEGPIFKKFIDANYGPSRRMIWMGRLHRVDKHVYMYLQ